ncbi:MAG TPA: hypothetical protein VN948_11920 [Terriglobales bacterium]|nr:hypothetical protein [Terriglobales bacterium]
MKQFPRFSKTPVSLPGSFHQRLSAYALAVSAAGVGIASMQPAQAKIIYKPTHHTLTNGTLPIPIDGTHDFTLSDKFYIITGSWSTQLLDINVAARAFVVGSKGSAAALKRGAVIGPTDKFQTGKVLMAGGFCETQISSSRVFGPFANTTQRYLGLKFKLNGKLHYGWARFASVIASACNGGPAVSATLTGYAYETIPGKSIKAGQTKGPDDSTLNPDSSTPEDPGPDASLTNPIPDEPQPASLGLLALGAQGVPLWRRKESVGATQ